MAIAQTKQQLHTEEVKNSIIAKAEELFSKYGVENVSMKELAKELGFTTGTIYHHFESKGDILKGIALRHFSRYSISFDDYRNADDPLNAIVKLFSEDMRKQVKEEGFEFTRYRVNNLVNVGRRNMIELLVEELLVRALEKEMIRSDTPCRQLSSIIMALFRESNYEYSISGGDVSCLDEGIKRISTVLDAFRK